MVRIVKQHWVSLFIGRNTAVYFNSFVIDYIPQEVLKNYKVITEIYLEYKIKNLFCVWFYCIVVMEYIRVEKIFLDFTNFFSPNDYKKNDKIIYKYFNDKYGRRSKF